MTPELLATLRTPAGTALLAEADASYREENTLALSTRLRRTHPVDLVAAALTQAQLRIAAAAKFDPADARRMFFTRAGLEQATRAPVARHRAVRMAGGLAAGNSASVIDLGCGIGGDLIELARAGLTVTGVDRDPLTLAVATTNVDVLDLAGRAQLTLGDATAVDRQQYQAAMCDPARRTTHGRVFDLGAYQPSWSFIEELLTSDACVSVGPGIAHEKVPAGVEAEWVSDHGEVKEAALWSGTLADPSIRRRATLLPTGSTLADTDDPGTADVKAPGRYLYEPDGAVIRAGLVTAAAVALNAWMIDGRIAYLSNDAPAESPFARRYEIVDRLPYDLRVLRHYVHDQGIGALTIKKRGVGVVPETLRRHLRPRGERAATFVVTRVREAATVLVVEPACQRERR